VSVKEARIKTNISSQICYSTKVQELSVQLYCFAFVLARIIYFVSGVFYFTSFICLFTFSCLH